MTLCKYTIYDSALEAYHQDYSLENDAIALRQFADMANEETQICQKSGGLFAMANWAHLKTTTGELTPEEPTCLAKAHEHVLQFKKTKNKEITCP